MKGFQCCHSLLHPTAVLVLSLSPWSVDTDMNILTNYYRADTSAITVPESDDVLTLNRALSIYTFRLLVLFWPPLTMLF